MNYYVYALSDPQTDEVFYIGKGLNQRAAQHAQLVRRGQHPNPFLSARIQPIHSAGLCPTIHILFDKLPEWRALFIERQLIDRIGPYRLCNQHPGQRSWMEAQMARATALLPMLYKLPFGVNDTLRTQLIHHCEGMSQGRYLVPPVLMNGDADRVAAFWNGTWRVSKVSNQVSHATA